MIYDLTELNKIKTLCGFSGSSLNDIASYCAPMSFLYSLNSKKRKKAKDKTFYDCLYIASDIGLGTHINKDDELFTKINTALKELNSYLFIVRGEHDNPQYFTTDLIDLSNFKTIQDYSVIKTKEHTTLCIGGGITPNRSWKKKNKKDLESKGYTIPQTYFEEELPFYHQKELISILTSGVTIDSVFTNFIPCLEFTRVLNFDANSIIKQWSRCDESLEKDFQKIHEIAQNIYNFFINNKLPINFWAYNANDGMNINKKFSDETTEEKVMIPFIGCGTHRICHLDEYLKEKDKSLDTSSLLKSFKFTSSFSIDDLFVGTPIETSEGVNTREYGELLERSISERLAEHSNDCLRASVPEYGTIRRETISDEEIVAHIPF